MENKQKTIVIVGGGFGGINAAILLAKKVSSTVKVILIDRADYHLYHPSLYEVASSEEEFTSIADMKHSIAIPFKEVLPKSVQFIQSTVTAIDQKAKSVTLQDGNKIPFDYLVVALGSQTDFFNIPGMEQYGVKFKSLTEALKIRNAVEFLVESHRMDIQKKLIRIVVSGGGFSGVELAGELSKLRNILSWKYNYSPDKVEIMIVEGTNQLLPGIAANFSSRILGRLKDLGVQVRLGNFITKAEPGHIVFSNGETVNYDLLIWAGGVKSMALPFVQAVELDKKGRVLVDAHLNLPADNSIYVIGDSAALTPALPQTATQAIDQGLYVAKAITEQLKGGAAQPFQLKQFGVIVSVGGKWAGLHYENGFNYYGFFGWIAHRYADLRYFLRLMPFFKALRLALFDVELYTRND